MGRRGLTAVGGVLLLLAGALGSVPAGTVGFGDLDAEPAIAHEHPDHLARTPPMGWNSWNAFARAIDEDLIKETADAMVASGMRDAG
jgi:alpha-galactosidase